MTNPVDLRDLDPPGPLLAILDTIALPGHGPHVFLLTREPLLLYPLLAQGGWRHSIRMGEMGCELTVFRNPHNP